MKMKKVFKVILIIALLGLIIGGIAGYYFYNKIFSPNVDLGDNESVYLYIPTNATYEQVLDSLYSKEIIIDKTSFEWVANLKKYNNLVKSGKYLISNNLSNNDLIDLLRSGKQEPVNVTFNNIRLKKDLASKISLQIEADSISLLDALNNDELVKNYGFTTENILSMFIPNTYEFYWNTSTQDFLDRMYKEYKKFWTEERLVKAEKVGLTQLEVSVLASIVQAEQAEHSDEQPKIAGLYLNRINQGIALQSDPTLVYASGDFTIKRVLNKHKEIDSPYNTYLYAGLPPAPINLPEISALDAVLNPETHDYIFMCAKEDFSGYHYFSRTNSQHNIYAEKYQNALNKLGIK